MSRDSPSPSLPAGRSGSERAKGLLTEPSDRYRRTSCYISRYARDCTVRAGRENRTPDLGFTIPLLYH
jgi:hypothetical protein